MGVIRFKMSGCMMRELMVHHILDLRRNLLSLSLLEEAGYEFSEKDGVLNVRDG